MTLSATGEVPASTDIMVCQSCGSMNVYWPKWVNPNTHDISYKDAGLEGLCHWCVECNEVTQIVSKEHYHE